MWRKKKLTRVNVNNFFLASNNQCLKSIKQAHLFLVDVSGLGTLLRPLPLRPLAILIANSPISYTAEHAELLVIQFKR